ncbi:MAG: permease-like cell division protein FtsX [bacterium]|nr:permease-like cell division protein FtsX [bacterium]MXZ30843.1 ABC transporter permease [Acidimicrobiia bacterium]MYB25515.1 ABC transporter permease [Acidimicrobiia bacterium]MYE66665.1 ABC transporter permease [Acidimicrobiia bacterium]MYJ12886.1 ABC transporter permease [Acidimicrobiia bacterium]
MAVSLGYVFRETRGNLRWNVTLFAATIVAVWVSLTLFGSSLLIREGVEQATGRWQGGIEFIVFMNADAEEAQHAAVRSALEENPEIGGYDYVDQQGAFNEFITEFADRPELIENVTPEILPPSYRVKPTVGDADVIEALAAQFETRPGVRQVTLPVEVIRTLQQNSQKVSVFVLVIAIVVLLAALMLIANTIRTAIFARRQDIEVMKLVGASNWYVRLPFMVEGTVQGVIGGALAIPMLFLMNNLMAGFVQEDYLELLRSLVVDSAVVWNTSLLVTGIGAAVGVLGSLFAVGRFLDV